MEEICLYHFGTEIALWPKVSLKIYSFIQSLLKMPPFQHYIDTVRSFPAVSKVGSVPVELSTVMTIVI
jgi:hypothetical protein